jgi:hypothetical protein
MSVRDPKEFRLEPILRADFAVIAVARREACLKINTFDALNLDCD